MGSHLTLINPLSRGVHLSRSPVAPQCEGFEWAAAFPEWLWAATDIGRLHMVALEREVERRPSQKGSADQSPLLEALLLETSERMETLPAVESISYQGRIKCSEISKDFSVFQTTTSPTSPLCQMPTAAGPELLEAMSPQLEALHL